MGRGTFHYNSLLKAPFNLALNTPRDGAFSSPGWATPTLSAFPHMSGVPAPWLLLWPPLDPLQQAHVFPVLRAPELDAGLQVGSHQCGAEGQNHLPRPAGHAAFDAAQDMVGLLGCERRLLACVQLFIHWYPQAFLGVDITLEVIYEWEEKTRK